MRRWEAATGLALSLVIGMLIGYGWAGLIRSATSPDPLVCAHLRDVLTDPESQTSHGPDPDAVRAWEQAECEGLR